MLCRMVFGLGMDINGRDEQELLDSSPLSTDTISDTSVTAPARRIPPAAIAGIVVAVFVILVALVVLVVLGMRKARQLEVGRARSKEAQHQILVEKPTIAPVQTDDKNPDPKQNQNETQRPRWLSLQSLITRTTRRNGHSPKERGKGRGGAGHKHAFILPVFSTHATTAPRQNQNAAAQTPSVLFTSVIDSSEMFSAGTPSWSLSDGGANGKGRSSRRSAEVNQARRMRSSQMVSFSDRSHDDLNLGWVQFVSVPAVKRPVEAAVRRGREVESSSG